MTGAVAWLAILLGLGEPAASAARPADAAARPAHADELARLAGHAIERLPGDRYRIADVAGEGPPRVGVIERRGEALVLVEASGEAHRLSGPLAVPRIAGPGYAVWVIGELDAGGALRARRLGVLAPPARQRAASISARTDPSRRP